MQPIRKLDDLVSHVRTLGRRFRVAVACGQDPNTVGAVARAVELGFAAVVLLGDATRIAATCAAEGVAAGRFEIVDIPDEKAATREAVRLVRGGEADVLMKGLVGTDAFLRAVMDRERGLLAPGAVMSYVCAIEVPRYPRLLFVTDPAVLPFPDTAQKLAMVRYAVAMAHRFGIDCPRVALVSAVEKPSEHFPSHADYAVVCKAAERGQLGACTVDGPLDVFLACDPASVEIKGVPTPIGGQADVLVFPTIEACNAFYKGLMLFAGGELGGIIQGTTRPVVVMSRSESARSKLYCIALACLMA
ncbi:MAG TPA: phosphate acyltransferase [Thermoanaerobaculaceae bacterium]|nr:phosphate acyltransferase [Thermoanaerobaculaceae bacterium]HRS16771.1 phosphate acyltransferase [Thermoanaerobaculaceae bacterium]